MEVITPDKCSGIIPAGIRQIVGSNTIAKSIGFSGFNDCFKITCLVMNGL
jgi:hypothetical protein